jgi:bifunctional pyridoxal-dependent enzyme with beta-cystathionase and maltose regulon repressor activities
VYFPFSRSITLNKRRLVNCPLVLEDQVYKIDYENLDAKARDPDTTMLIFCSPHNPVGRVWQEDELRQVAEICGRRKILMVSDEIHFDILLPGLKHRVYATLSEEAAQNCIVCTAPSKTFNLAGLQTSNIIVPNREIREKLSAQFAQNSLSGLNSIGLKACEIAYTQCEAWLEELRLVIAANHRLVADFMAKNLPMIKVFPLEGTYLQWLDFRPFGMDCRELERFMINDAQWFTDEGAMFGEEGRGFERVNIACPGAVLEEALERLLRALRSQKLA